MGIPVDEMIAENNQALLALIQSQAEQVAAELGVEVPAAAFRAPRRAQPAAPGRRAFAPKAADIAAKERLR